MKCKFPGCHKVAGETWAQIPLCYEHRDAISEETIVFYTKKDTNRTEVERRPFYSQISDQIPWSKANMKVGDWK